MARRCCYNCVYAVCDPEVWLRWQWMGLPLVPQCANHPSLPGQLQEVTGTACRNYHPKPPAPKGDVRLIPLGDGCYAYVETADYKWLSRWNWHLSNGYAARSEKGKIILMHRQIMRPPKGKIVDHIDGSKANNCRFNLRVCTRAENMQNKRRHSGSSSQFKGVYRDKRSGKWNAQCRRRGKSHPLGCFGDDEVAAARAYDRQAVEWFGPYARVNFPDEWPPERRAEVYAPPNATKRKSEAKKRKTATTRKAKGKKALPQPPGAKPRTTTDRKRATKQAKVSKRKTQNARCTTKSKQATGQKLQAAVPKGSGRKTRHSTQKTRKKRSSRTG